MVSECGEGRGNFFPIEKITPFPSLLTLTASLKSGPDKMATIPYSYILLGKKGRAKKDKEFREFEEPLFFLCNQRTRNW